MDASTFRHHLNRNSRYHMVPLVTDERYAQFGRNALDANAGLRARYRNEALEAGRRVDPRYQDVAAFYDNHADSTARAFSIFNEAERNAGRLLNPANYTLIRHYYRNEPSERSMEPRSQTPFLGRSSESPTYLGQERGGVGFINPIQERFFLGNSAGTTRLPQGESFDMSSFLGRSASPMGVLSRLASQAMPGDGFDMSSFLGRTSSAPASVADSVSGMMGGGVVQRRTPFRNGGVMDRMVSEMTRNIASR